MTEAKTRNNKQRHELPGMRIHCYLAPETIEAVEREAAKRFESRTHWIEVACLQRIEREKRG